MKRFLHATLTLALLLGASCSAPELNVHLVSIPEEPRSPVIFGLLWFKEGKMETLLERLREEAPHLVPSDQKTAEGRARLRCVGFVDDEFAWLPEFESALLATKQPGKEDQPGLEAFVAWPRASETPEGSPSAKVRRFDPDGVRSLYHIPYPEQASEGWFVISDPGKGDDPERGDWLIRFYPSLHQGNYDNQNQDYDFIVTVRVAPSGDRVLVLDVPSAHRQGSTKNALESAVRIREQKVAERDADKTEEPSSE